LALDLAEHQNRATAIMCRWPYYENVLRCSKWAACRSM